jgi:hypothetical protein
MKYLIAIVIILTALSVQGAPFLTSDNQPTATYYTISGGPSFIPATVQGTAIHVDLVNYQIGSWPIKVKACKTDPLWGVQCSEEASFTLTCPSPTGGLTKPVIQIEQ